MGTLRGPVRHCPGVCSAHWRPLFHCPTAVGSGQWCLLLLTATLLWAVGSGGPLCTPPYCSGHWAVDCAAAARSLTWVKNADNALGMWFAICSLLFSTSFRWVRVLGRSREVGPGGSEGQRMYGKFACAHRLKGSALM